MQIIAVLAAVLLQDFEHIEKPYRLAGIENPQEARLFLDWLKAAASDGDRQILTAVVRYPFTIWNSGKPVRVYKNQAALAADFDRVYTPQVRKAIRAATFESLFVRDQGVMIGDGEVWFYKGKDGIRIHAINN